MWVPIPVTTSHSLGWISWTSVTAYEEHTRRFLEGLGQS